MNIRISDIAKLAGVSAGTVDRVLHNRGRVSEEKRALVERVLKEMNYQPNPLARTLASHREIRILTLTPEYHIGEYWEQVNSGISHASKSLQSFGIKVDQRFFNQYNRESFSQLIARLETEISQPEVIDGVIIATLFEQESRKIAKQLEKAQIPYILIDSNIVDCNPLAYFGADSYQSGRVAAHLLTRACVEKSILAITYAGIDGELSLQSRKRLQGFIDYLKENHHQDRFQQLTFQDGQHNYNRQLLQQVLCKLQPAGIAVFNSRVHEIVAMLTSSELHNIQLIGYDTIDSNAQALREQKVAWLIGQRATTQGFEAVKTLSNYVLFGQSPTMRNYMPIDILTKENINYYSD